MGAKQVMDEIIKDIREFLSDKYKKELYENGSFDSSCMELTYGEIKKIYDYIKESEKYMLGKKGICEDCGDEGEWRYEPYDMEIHSESNIICLCENCDYRRWEDV